MKKTKYLVLLGILVALLAVTGCKDSNTQSDNADLEALSLSDVTFSPAFSADVMAYTASVPNEVSSTSVTATPEDSDATIECTPGDDPIALAEGDNTIEVCVTAENGDATKTYSVVVTRAEGRIPAENADLEALTLSAGTLTPGFNADVTAYTATVANTVTTITVTAVPDETGATAAVVPANPVALDLGANTITITVTAPNGTTTRDYTVVVTRGAPETVYYNDAFTGAVSAANLVTTAYRPLTDDPTRPMYLNVNGAVTWAGGIVTMGADTRFAIGANDITATTETTTPGGCFNFATPTTLRIRFGAAGTGLATGYFQVYVNNNTTAARNSPAPLSNQSRIRNVVANTIVAGSTVDIAIPTEAGADSFLCFRTDNDVTGVRIDEITLVR